MFTDIKDSPSPVPSPAPSGLPSNNNNNVPSTTQSYTTSTNNHSTTSNPPSTSNGPFQYETFQTFDWDNYLKETNSKAAPIECFKQVQYNLV